MKNLVLVAVGVVAMVVAGLSTALVGQEEKPVPKDSARVTVSGCSKGYVFTAGPPSEDRPGGSAIPEGMHLRMNGKKQLLSEIKGMEGSRIEITGLVKKGQMAPEGVRIAPGVRITAGSPSTVGASVGPSPSVNQIMIDVEGWRHVAGECRSR
jgi:hypothetical protein